MTAATAVQFTTKTGKPSLRKPSRFVSLMLKNDEGATLMTLFERLPTGRAGRDRQDQGSGREPARKVGRPRRPTGRPRRCVTLVA
jgi:hypothetical protein